MKTNERTSETANVREPGRATVRLVFVGVTANALTQFAIQAFMSYRFAKDVWEIPRILCGGVIVALDLFAVMFMVFTYLLRRAKWHTQLYVWFVFTAGVGAQLFAAELYGAHENWSLPVRLFAALPALFLAASLHGLIIWRNHASTPRAPEQPTVAPARHVATPAERAAGRAPVTERPARSTSAPKPPPVVKSGRRGNPNQDRAVARALAGEDTAVIAKDLGVTRRAVQIWKQKAQDAPMIPQVNGHEFTPGAATEAQVN